VSSAVPDRPLLAPWFRLVEDGDRLLLEHGQSVVVLEGAAVARLLPHLLPLLDGTRTVDQLVDRLGEAVREAILQGLETLAAHGLLAEGPPAADGARATAHAFAAAYGLAPSPVAARLEGAVVGVVGESAAASDIARLLIAAGVGRVQRHSWDRAGDVDLVVVAPAADESQCLGPWNDAALAAGLRWLPVLGFDGRFAAVGPLVIPGESCCYQCFSRRRAANLEFGDDLAAIQRVPVAAVADPAFAALVVALAAHVVLRWLAGEDRTVPGVLYAVEAQPLPAITDHTVLRVPRCPACSDAERLAPVLPWHAAEAA
jgi:bacteriocin biosynthesis cyclodehydratase domain-containing protein